MIRILLILLFLIQLPNVYAFNHIKFMGMELTGSIDEFKDSLIAKGFLYKESYKASYEFYGVFANEMVELTVLASPKTKIVCKVIIDFQNKSTWRELKKDYFEKKKLYRTKYILDKDFEFFSSPYEEGDGYELKAVSHSKCNYVSFFEANKGHIVVEIDKSAGVRVVYEDDENMKIANQELKQSVFEDI